jgi:hypothetical protein
MYANHGFLTFVGHLFALRGEKMTYKYSYSSTTNDPC